MAARAYAQIVVVQVVAFRMFALATKRLLLRKLGEADLDALVELDSDPEVMRYINGGKPNSRELYLESLLPRMLAWSEDDPVGFYAAIFEGAWVGWFHLRPSIADEAALELGYRLRRTAWGKGLATEGSRVLASFAVDELRPPWIDGCAHPDNHASIAVLRKCGLSYVDMRMHPRAPIEVAFYRASPDGIVRSVVEWRRCALQL
jgi:RimJ/RimL family protein N-acetyltransferase